MTVDLFAGNPVRDYGPAAAWYERLLGAPPSFLPYDTGAVWGTPRPPVRVHRSAARAGRAGGHAGHAVFVSDFDARIAQIVERDGSRPRETYANGVRKATFRDPEGNEIGFGGDPA